jgi:lysophospholipase L1-like esterase
VGAVRFVSYANIGDERGPILKVNKITKKEGSFKYIYAKSNYINAKDEEIIGSGLLCVRTEYIPCAAGDVFIYSGRSAGDGCAYLFYDSEKGVVKSFNKNAIVENEVVCIPNGVYYVRFQTVMQNQTPLKVSKVDPNPNLVAAELDKGSKLYGKKINVLGDSYVANHQEPISYTWHYKLAQRYAMTYRNYGINGNSMVGAGDAMQVRYAEMDDDADYVVVIGGTNDYNGQTPIETFKTGLKSLILGLVAKYPYAKIAFFTIWNCGYPRNVGKAIEIKLYNDAIVDVCHEYNIPVFDAWRWSGMRMYDEAFMTEYTQVPDIAHLNEKGHERFLPLATEFMNFI